MMHTKYILVRSETGVGLEESVSRNLRNGWRLYGETRMISHNGGLIYFQAMTREEA